MRIEFDFHEVTELSYKDAAKAIRETLKAYRQLVATDHSKQLLHEDEGNIWMDGDKVGTFVVSQSPGEQTPEYRPDLTDEQIAKLARDEWIDVDEIDMDNAKTPAVSRSEDGAWVAAWVWIEYPEVEDELCECGRHVKNCATFENSDAQHGDRWDGMTK